MDAWLIVCLVLAAVGIFTTKDHAVIQGIAVGLFAGLMMALVCPLMPAVSKGITIISVSTEMMSRKEVLINGLGWLIVFFPVSIFYLVYSHRFPMNSWSLFRPAVVFAISYSAVLQIAIFQSALIGIRMNLLVFFVVYVAMLGFSWAIRGWRLFTGVCRLVAINNAEHGIAGRERHKT